MPTNEYQLEVCEEDRLAMAFNDDYLRIIANVVDPDGSGSGGQFNNDYLRRIAEGIETMTSAIDPETGDVDATKLSGVIPLTNLPSDVGGTGGDEAVNSYYTYEDVGDVSYLTHVITVEDEEE